MLLSRGLELLMGDHFLVPFISITVNTILVAFLFYQQNAKNAFIYSDKKTFGIRLQGKQVDIEAKHISEVSYDDSKVLKVRRINRVDTFDLSPFKEQDRLKVVEYVRGYLREGIRIENQPILTQ